MKTKSTLALLDNRTNFGGTQEFVLQITATPLSQLGTYTVTVTATGGGQTHSIDLTLKIRISVF